VLADFRLPRDSVDKKTSAISLGATSFMVICWYRFSRELLCTMVFSNAVEDFAEVILTKSQGHGCGLDAQVSLLLFAHLIVTSTDNIFIEQK